MEQMVERAVDGLLLVAAQLLLQHGVEPREGADAELAVALDRDDPRVRQVTASLAASWQQVEIVRADGTVAADIRPLVRVNVAVVVGDGDRQETGSYGMGGRKAFAEFLTEDSWKFGAGEALDLQSTTGARGARVLGGIYPA